MAKKKTKLKIIPLGGLGEIGKNMTVFETEEDIVIVDCGLAFPDYDMPGIDSVIPDITYLNKNADKIRGIVITHGHEDHIGNLPFFLKKINVPVYGTKFTCSLVNKKLEEHGLQKKVHLQIVKHGEVIKFGTISVEFIRTNHSIPDASAFAITTPAGVIVHTGDFKVDLTPIDGDPIDLARLGELGKKGVLLLMSDSTNVEREGYTMSEKTVGITFDEIIGNTEGRIIVATFASNVHRIQQIIDASVKYGRKVAVVGRSMENIVELAVKDGFMNIPDGVLIDIDSINKYKSEELVIVSTGSQGEPMSALTRMANDEHKKVKIVEDDTIVVSASAIPGNEKFISKVIDDLFKKGAQVIYQSLADIHVSGHACQEELKMIMHLTKPKYFMPVHGEYRHLIQHARLAKKMGIPSENIFVLENGNCLELTNNSAKLGPSVHSGNVLVDGLGIGDVGNIVLRDRKNLSQDGLIVVVVSYDSESGEIVAGPDVISRGFVYVRESEDLIEKLKDLAKEAMERPDNKRKGDWSNKKMFIKDTIRDYVYEKTKRRPVILPIIMDVSTKKTQNNKSNGNNNVNNKVNNED